MTKDVSRRYLAVFLPFLSSERIKRGKRPDRPFVLVTKSRGSMLLAAVDEATLALGLVPGLALADARAQVPDLVTYDHNECADSALLNWLAEACDRYTPIVAIDPPQGIILDITGCIQSFIEGEAGLASDLAHRLNRSGFNAWLGLAATPDAAAALARHNGNNIRMLPTTALRVEYDVQLALMRAGLKTIGDIESISSAALAARFGQQLPDLLDRLLEKTDIRLTSRRAHPKIESEARFQDPITQSGYALRQISILIKAVCVKLSEQAAGGRQFTASLFRCDGHITRLTVETAQPTRDCSLVYRLFFERIDSFTDHLDPGFGYDMIRLAVYIMEPLGPEQLHIQSGRSAEQDIAAILDRLSTRLGRNRVRRFIPNNTHIPEQAVCELPVVDLRKSDIWLALKVGEPPLRPIHLFDPPQRIEAVAEVPDGPPRRFKWNCRVHEVIRCEGPERIAPEWWRKSNCKVTRDYYRIENPQGERYWLFRQIPYGNEQSNSGWFMHGLFA